MRSMQASSAEPSVRVVNVRRKRDLRSFFLRPWGLDRVKRRTRYKKVYLTKIPVDQPKPKFSGFTNLFSPFKLTPLVMPLRKPRTTLLSRLVKRDIKGEYDLLERERQQMDLTLPDIIQYMPETLLPNFKRGQCHFGCSNKLTEHSIQTTASPPTHFSNAEEHMQQQTAENFDINKNNVSNNHAKRNAASCACGLAPNAAATAHTQQQQQLPAANYADSAAAAAIATMPAFPIAQNAYDSNVPTAQYVYDSLGRKYLANGAGLRMVTTASEISDPTAADATPLRYAGELDNPAAQQLTAAPQYPVQYVSNAQIDKVISDIVYRHPEFIDASSHYAGALVDPEPVQKQQTTDLIKKLIDGRLSVLFGGDRQDLPFYDTAPHLSSDSSHNPYELPSVYNF